LPSRGGGWKLAEQGLKRGEALFERVDVSRLPLHLVQQHGREQLILDRHYLAVVIVRHHFGVDLRHFFGDQAISQQMRSVVVLRLVEEVHRTQRSSWAAAVGGDS
jgi:hypothetical protein